MSRPDLAGLAARESAALCARCPAGPREACALVPGRVEVCERVARDLAEGMRAAPAYPDALLTPPAGELSRRARELVARYRECVSTHGGGAARVGYCDSLVSETLALADALDAAEARAAHWEGTTDGLLARIASLALDLSAERQARERAEERVKRVTGMAERAEARYREATEHVTSLLRREQELQDRAERAEARLATCDGLASEALERLREVR